MSRVATVLGLSLLAARIAPAQSRFHFELQANGASVYANPVIGAVESTLSGTEFGGEARVGVGIVGLDLGYWQGSLSPKSGPASNEDIVEGKALLEIRPMSWFTVSAGPHARAYTTAAGTERWLTWRVQGRIEQDLVPATVRGYAEVWFVASGDVNVVQPFTSGRGGNVGLRLAPQHWPVWFTLGYGIEQIRLGGGSRLDTVDRVAVGVGYSR